MTYKVTKEYWTGTRMAEQRGITGYEEAKSIAAVLANSRSLAVGPFAQVFEGTNGYIVKFPLDGKLVPDCSFIVEAE